MGSKEWKGSKQGVEIPLKKVEGFLVYFHHFRNLTYSLFFLFTSISIRGQFPVWIFSYKNRTVALGPGMNCEIVISVIIIWVKQRNQDRNQNDLSLYSVISLSVLMASYIIFLLLHD